MWLAMAPPRIESAAALAPSEKPWPPEDADGEGFGEDVAQATRRQSERLAGRRMSRGRRQTRSRLEMTLGLQSAARPGQEEAPREEPWTLRTLGRREAEKELEPGEDRGRPVVA